MRTTASAATPFAISYPVLGRCGDLPHSHKQPEQTVHRKTQHPDTETKGAIAKHNAVHAMLYLCLQNSAGHDGA